MKDAYGYDLSIGDTVMFILNKWTSGYATYGKITRFTQCRVEIECIKSTHGPTRATNKVLKDPKATLKIELDELAPINCMK